MTRNYVLDPVNSPGYPHVLCSGCEQVFCAQRRILWRERRSYQQHRAENPALGDEAEV
jgi:hypothetical protein